MYAGSSSPKQLEVYDRGTAHLLMRAMSEKPEQSGWRICIVTMRAERQYGRWRGHRESLFPPHLEHTVGERRQIGCDVWVEVKRGTCEY
jgi:hypothetical protein